MPASVIAAVITNAIVTQIATTVMMSAFMTAALRLVIGFVVTSVVNSALGGKKASKAAESSPSPFVDSQKRTVTFKQAVVPWQIIYGQVRVGGAITYAQSSGSTLNLVITLAGHVCEEIGDIYFDDERVPLDGSGNATGRYAGFVSVKKSLGEEAGQPFPGLVTSSGGEWTTDYHWQKGRTKIWVSLTANRDLFPNGIPNITAIVKGRKVIDPRISPTQEAYSNNAALCSNDYLINSSFGFGADYATEINEDELISSANDCDDAIPLAGSPSATEARYTANGAISVTEEPKQILGYLLAAMSGKAANISGMWYIMAGVYSVPTIDLDESDLIGAIRVQSMVSRRENCNGIKGTFTDPDSLYQPSSFPAIASDTYMNEDGGERIWRDIDLAAFVTSGTQAQRIAKIDLLATRQGLSVVAPFRIRAWRALTGKTVSLTNTKFGWSAKPFEVAQTKLTVGEDGTLGVELTLRETAPAVYDWSTSDEQAVDLAPNSNLPDPFANLTISGLSASSGTADLFQQVDGTVVPRVRLRWTAPSNPFVSEYEVQFERLTSSPTEWIDEPKALYPKTETFIYGANDGEVINIRMRARTSIGNAGDWSYIYAHTVVGKTAKPTDVSGLAAVQSGSSVLISVNEITDADLDLIEIRLYPTGGHTWTDSDRTNVITNILRSKTTTTAAIPPGTWALCAKARDTSGNYSANETCIEIEVSSSGTTELAAQEAAPFHDGIAVLTNMVRHWTGVLTPDSQSLASALDWEVFDQCVPNPYTDCYAEDKQIDTGGDGTARIWGSVESAVGPGVSSGTGACDFQADYRTAAGSYDGFENWTVGQASFRYCKGRLHLDTSVSGVSVVTGMTTNVDAESRTEVGTLTVDGTGTGTLTFTAPFRQTPIVSTAPQGSGAVSSSHDSTTTTGFTGYFKTAGVASAGTMTYTATGV